LGELLVGAGNNREGQRNYLQAAENLQRAADESAKAGDSSRATRFLLEAAAIYEKARQPAEASKCHMRAAEEDLKSENINGASENFRKATIEELLAGELEAARGIVDSIKNEEARKTAYFKQSLALVEIFEKGDEERLNNALREINDFSWVRLSIAFGKARKVGY
jgi:hypothetical protein